MPEIYGVDGCRGGWVAVRRDLDTARTRWGIYGSLDHLLEERPAIVAIDVPIGLTDSGARRCDQEARRLLGPRRSSIFPSPLRCALESISDGAACSASRSAHGKALSRQSVFAEREGSLE